MVKLRVHLEDKAYDVAVEVLDDGLGSPRASAEPPEIAIPASVYRERPPLKLLEDAFCRSPIAGRVIAVLQSVGQRVRKNEPVLVIEAMKMEIKVAPAVDGAITAIHVKPGELVATGQVLFELA